MIQNSATETNFVLTGGKVIMRITETAVKRGVTFAMIYLIAVGFGLFSLGRLKLDLYPKLEFPVIALITQYTGVGPFDMETVVTRPLEETVSIVESGCTAGVCQWINDTGLWHSTSRLRLLGTLGRCPE